MVEKLKYTDILNVADDTPEEVREALDSYFSNFISLKEVCKENNTKQTCHSCQKDLNGFFGTFTWGIIHGEGVCSNCLWPCRGMHYLKDTNGKEIGTIRNFVLQYHPDLVERKE